MIVAGTSRILFNIILILKITSKVIFGTSKPIWATGNYILRLGGCPYPTVSWAPLLRPQNEILGRWKLHAAPRWLSLPHRVLGPLSGPQNASLGNWKLHSAPRRLSLPHRVLGSAARTSQRNFGQLEIIFCASVAVPAPPSPGVRCHDLRT